MLRFLSIKRLAVIDAVEVEFEPGLNVLTGETGAGKSILVEAVGLLLGGRAAGDLVRTGEDVATIEAIFESGGEELLVKREITSQGRSRAYVNGELVTAGALRDLSRRLIELHGQHEHHTLLDPVTHLDVVDAFGVLGRLTESVADAFDRWRAAREGLARARKTVTEREARQELVAFQLGELDRAAIVSGEEDTDLAAARQVLANAERIERLCEEGYASLYESDGAILSNLGQVWRRVSDLAAIDPRFQTYLDARDGIKSQLEELALFLRRYADAIEASPARLQELEERLALLERLKRKYGPSLAECLSKRDALRLELAELEGADQHVADLARTEATARSEYLGRAQALALERRRVATPFARGMEALAADLAMERTRFEVRFGEPLPEDAWSARGIDTAEFFVSPNPGEELRALARVVSGGELSRLMLAIKSLTATSRAGWTDAADRPPGGVAPGLIFDEVDAGIGGRVAEVVGRKLRALGSAFQVLCITHLPQIAACADTHFAIEKRVERGRTRTSVARLDAGGRVEELSRMLGGATVTEGLRASAREMLAARQPGAGGAKGESKSKGESERSKAKGGRGA
jgi:DNA repair protein RecN (Recombination protein N)